MNSPNIIYSIYSLALLAPAIYFGYTVWRDFTSKDKLPEVRRGNVIVFLVAAYPFQFIAVTFFTCTGFFSALDYVLTLLGWVKSDSLESTLIMAATITALETFSARERLRENFQTSQGTAYKHANPWILILFALIFLGITETIMFAMEYWNPSCSQNCPGTNF